jgi:hypothetical protein
MPQAWIQILHAERVAALIAWMLLVRVGGFVKGLRPPKAAALRAALDETANTNTVLSMRSRPLSRPSGVNPVGTGGAAEME